MEFFSPKSPTKIKKYRVPGCPGPINLRDTVSDHSIFWQCIVQRQYDMIHFPQSERLMSAYRGFIENGERVLIIDCGGNIGLSALYLASLFPSATVYAVEPDKSNFELLKDNTAALDGRVVALRGGVWQESGNLTIVNPESGSAAFRVAATEVVESDSIRAFTINEICALAGVQFPFIVKIDIEGAQANLFKGDTSWVGNAHLIMLELDDWLMPWQGTSRPFFASVSRYPFDYLISGETIFCFRDFGNGRVGPY
jgi:FkbM family methyltransferase